MTPDVGIQVLVAENFDSIVNDDSKDVLIEFYAPWCGHCKNLEPKYNELGEKVRNQTHVLSYPLPPNIIFQTNTECILILFIALYCNNLFLLIEEGGM